MPVRKFFVLLGLCALLMEDAASSPGSRHSLFAPNALWAQGAYPRVMSPTGRFYGPTQAHYQYERQYGQPWWGGPAPVHPNMGAPINVQVPNFGFGFIDPGFGGYYVNTLPYGAYGYGYQNYGFAPQNLNTPLLNGYEGNSFYQSQSGFGGMQQYYGTNYGNNFNNFNGANFGGPQFQYSWQRQFEQQLQARQGGRTPLPPLPGDRGIGERGIPGQEIAGRGFGGGRPNPPGPVIQQQPVGREEPVVTRARQLIPPQPSSLEQQARSIHFQGQGDIWLRQQNYLQAYSRYKQAASAAPDLAAPRFRMAYALIALKRYELAVTELVRGIQLDPRYPVTGDSPAKVFGPENQIAVNALPGQVADWVRQEMQAPDRLFLLGAVLRLNGDFERSHVCLEAAAQLTGQAAPVMAFLRLDPKMDQILAKTKSSRPRIPEDDQGDQRPPVPEAVEELLRNNQNWTPAAPRRAPVGAPRDLGTPREQNLSGPTSPSGPTLIGPPRLLPGNSPNQSDPNQLGDETPRRTTPRVEPQSEPAENAPTVEDDQPQDVPPVPVIAPKLPEAVPSPVPGFQPIPKKGSESQPMPGPAPETTPDAEESATGTEAPMPAPAEAEPKGPVIPNPQPASP